MSYKNEKIKMIELHENGLDIQFRIRENGVVELADFSSQEVKKAVMEPKEDICYPAVEIHRSGTGSLNMHAYKNNINQSSVDFVYENHELKAQAGGKELEIVMISPEKLRQYIICACLTECRQYRPGQRSSTREVRIRG